MSTYVTVPLAFALGYAIGNRREIARRFMLWQLRRLCREWGHEVCTNPECDRKAVHCVRCHASLIDGEWMADE